MKTVFAIAIAAMMPLASMSATYDKGLHYEQQVSSAVSVGAGAELHIKSVDDPLGANASINLEASDSWLVFEGVKASAVKARWLAQVKVVGSTVVDGLQPGLYIVNRQKVIVY